MPRKLSKKGLHQKLWLLQGQQIKKREANFQGRVQCFTCFEWIPVKEAQIGHFWHNKLDFDERNLKIQDVKCNHFLGGNLGRYAARLIKENGIEWYEQLERDKNQFKGYGLKDLKEIQERLQTRK